MFEGVDAHCTSPVKFNKETERNVFSKRDGAMHGNAHEGRFTMIDVTNPVNSKFKSPLAPNFGKGIKYGLDLMKFP
jgi:hypothetical protein